MRPLINLSRIKLLLDLPASSGMQACRAGLPGLAIGLLMGFMSAYAPGVWRALLARCSPGRATLPRTPRARRLAT